METKEERQTQKKLKVLPDNCVIVDIETTGLNPDYEAIIEISALKIKENKIIKEFSSLVRPNKKISSFVQNLTGITNKMTDLAPPTDFVLKKFLDFIEDFPIVGHNIRFDLSFLNKNIQKAFNKEISNDYSDTLYFARRVYKDLKSRKLTAIAEHLNIDTKNAHRALKDCYMTYEIMQDMKNKIKEKAPQ